MHRSVPRVPAALISCLILAGIADAQRPRSEAARHESVAARPAQSPAEADASRPAADDPATLPGDLLEVPGGEFDVGYEADELVEIEESLHRLETQQVRDIGRLMSELGVRRDVGVQPFLMAKHPVTNGEYEVFVKATGHRFPFHWWKDGESDHYEQTMPEAREAFPEADNPYLAYWESNWRDLPWSIPQDQIDRQRFEPMDDYPVIYVSWEDAVAYAGWAGMRLPTEIEWMFAARGEEQKEFLWGDDYDAIPVQRGSRYDRLWEVGHWGDKTAGKFGHQDMVLGVWEWTGALGFFPYVELDEWKRERQSLLREKLLRNTDDRYVRQVHDYVPDWSGNHVVLKGGMYASTPKSSLRIGIRAPIESVQTTDAIGFRVAKSARPGYDFLDSKIKVDYDWSYFSGEIEPNLADQVGVERYELTGPNQERIAGYHAVSFAPVSHATEEERMNRGRLLAQTIEDNRPLVLGTLAVTGELRSPDIPAGAYTLLYRASGAPKPLSRAIGEAQRAIKLAERSGETPTGDWSAVLKKYNVTLEDVKAGTIDFIRLKPGDLKVPSEQHSFLLRDKSGEYTAVWEATGSLESKTRYEAGDAKITVTAGRDGIERLRINFGVPVDARARGRVYSHTLEVEVPQEWAGGARWRKPAEED